MIRKAIIQGISMLAVFALIWLGFSQIDYMGTFKVNEKTKDLEDEVGDMLWKSIRQTERVIGADSVRKPVEKLFAHLAEANHIDPDDIMLHIIEKDEVNAFAMPGNHMVIYTGLLAECKNEEQLAGVLGHELAHLKKGHVMKKLGKEIGLSVLVSMTSGGAGSEAVKEGLQVLTSSAYDRNLETEADITAIEYMLEADMDPRPMADFLYGMSVDAPKEAFWISTHPDPEERGKEVLEYLKNERIKSKKVLTDAEWNSLKKRHPLP